MESNEILSLPSFLPEKKPKKLFFLLHGYGDSSENFIHIANSLHQPQWKINYFGLNGPNTIPNYPLGRQWFDLYPNKIYIADAGPNEIKIIKKEILIASKAIENIIKKISTNYGLSYCDCFLIGFSQGGMMAFEFGNYLEHCLGGIGILSGQILNENNVNNSDFLKTPIFISHGEKDDVLDVSVFYKACKYLKKNKFSFDYNLIKEDFHNISPKAISLLQKFIKKNL